ncbi:hypothetical protein PsYK624_007060 [Phanerochaete sordida]|uniref:Uncharacterized protein n=1 Tax=Phanerochaete sordida TaxID=48140 RepID=A0A9P3FYR0_9APHY|nr:hypothetical protein PsYK624_007060 [Phanerochaete sordida]
MPDFPARRPARTLDTLRSTGTQTVPHISHQVPPCTPHGFAASQGSWSSICILTLPIMRVYCTMLEVFVPCPPADGHPNADGMCFARANTVF